MPRSASCLERRSPTRPLFPRRSHSMFKETSSSTRTSLPNVARLLGDDISESKPILDARLPDGSRVAAVIPPCSLGGITLTIRKFSAKHLTIDDLITFGSLDRELAKVLQTKVESRRNIL